MAKVDIKLEVMSPSTCPAVSVEEKPNCEVAVRETAANVTETGDDHEMSDTEADDTAEQKPLSHQQAMEHFKDALAEIIVVCKNPTVLLLLLLLLLLLHMFNSLFSRTT